MSHTVNSLKPITTPQKSDDPKSPTPKKSRRWLWILGGSVAIIAVGTGVWYLFFRPKPANFIQFNGRIEGYETDVSTKGTGRVEEITVREGDTVKKGQLLVRLSDEEMQSELRAATAQVSAAKQREANARLQISVLEDQLADGNLNLQQSEGDTQGKVAEAEALVSTAQAIVKQEQARVQEARALLEQARVDRDRYAHLALEGAETQQRYDVALTGYNTAEAALQSRLAAVEAAQKAVKIAQAKLTQAQTTTLNPGKQKTNVSRLQTQVQQARNTLTAAQADVKTAQANQNLIQSRLNNLTVKSPINGVVTTRSVEPGTVVLPSRPLLRVVDLNQVYMRGFIPDGQIAQVRVGQLARVYLDNDPKHQNSFKATVAAIDSKASFTPENVYFQSDRVQQVFGVKLNLAQPGRLAKPGMPADGEIPLQSRIDSR
ncbi:efflux RND transporter periplasmic adaptor subunit [Aetokthonos hydrillicola Thurmond2011]|jgi:HlyD family secretion protein|uniref:Efflux RND transporter periplasmic adaptor subunit n=1 Tax=Aetokthonos hydrillicola Thurmond2011 TaxID=2712845 RepID=A0AAP5I6D6_9CYAN|nr:efflux RND transporter periplasmic adaptor subunit [Aetokthonos hydrillicola]MBW4591021.1 efflux RND transporter periplasmic adaptor subunit [Aetokthonos hydrillicola CCALA 1050]MDR9894609.1 efflux RND transporter periplasmic adaptor subunit [Aetokthonos hydrillicola Thurmond2011]